MRSKARSLPEMLRYEASRRPDIQAMLDRAETLTDQEIAAAPVPLPWFRNALTMARDEARRASAAQQGMGFIEAHTHIVPNRDPVGEARLWSAATTYLRVSRGGHVEMKESRYLFLPDEGGVWIGSMYSATIDRQVTYATPVGRMTLTEYKQLNEDAGMRDCPPDACVIDLTGRNETSSAASRLAGLNVQFFR